jgi:hypothetical protein
MVIFNSYVKLPEGKFPVWFGRIDVPFKSMENLPLKTMIS